MLIPTLLNKLNQTAGLTYRFVKLAFKLQYVSQPAAVLEKFAVFIVGDVNGRKKLALAWFAVSLVAGKVNNLRRSKAANQQVLDADFNHNKVIELSEVEALLAQNVASRQGQRIKKRSEAVTRGGFLFLRHCLMRFAAGDAHVTKLFGKREFDRVVLDSYACLTAYFGTHSCTKVADAILSSKDGSDPSITVLADHMSHAVHEIRNALKNDLIGLLVL